MRFVFTPLLMVTLSSTAFATPELRQQMEVLAKDVLANTKQQAVTIGQFSGTGLPNSNSGPGIEQVLKEALEAQQRGAVRDDAKFEVKGDYLLVPSKTNPALKAVRVKARILELETGEELKESRIDVELGGNNTIAEVLQVTAALDPHGAKVDRNQEIERAAKSPSVHIHGPQKSLVSSTASSPCSVELLVKSSPSGTPQPRAAHDEKGLAFVGIQKDELYELRIHNRSSKEVAVAVSIDGLDVFHFTKDRTDGKPNYSHQIIGPQSTDIIHGWHNSIHGNENVLSFLVTGYGQGAVTKAGITARGKVGIIHVQFSECEPLPPGGKSRSGNETGFGPPKKVEQKVVSYEIHPPHDFVSVRYTR